MGGCRGVVRRVEARGRTRQTQIGSQGVSSVMIIGGADDNGGDVGDADGAGWWRG